MYKPLEEFLKQEEYKYFTLRKLQILHQKGYLKTITGENGKHLTTEQWLKEAIEREAEYKVISDKIEISAMLKRKPLRKNNVLKIV